jgi:hypothetical protein
MIAPCEGNLGVVRWLLAEGGASVPLCHMTCVNVNLWEDAGFVIFSEDQIRIDLPQDPGARLYSAAKLKTANGSSSSSSFVTLIYQDPRYHENDFLLFTFVVIPTTSI